MTTLADAAARSAAINTESSFAVSAPAGSGKTSLLTLRVLNLLAKVNAPEEVLAITFTRKAAQEMRERIIHALQRAAEITEHELANLTGHEAALMRSAKAAFLRNVECDWQLIVAPNRLHILTIDGFCRELAVQLPITSQLGVPSDILTLPEKAYRLAAERFIDDLGQQADTTSFRHLLSHIDNNLDRLAELLIHLLANRDQWLPLIYQLQYDDAPVRQKLEAALANWAADVTNQVADELMPYQHELLASARYAATHLQKTHPEHPLLAWTDITTLPTPEAENHHLWQSLMDLLLTQSGTFRKTVNKNNGFPTGKSKDEKATAKEQKNAFVSLLSTLATNPGLEHTLTTLQLFPALSYSDNQWRALDGLMTLLPRLAAHLKIVFQQLQQTDFIEIALAALNALDFTGDGNDLALRLDYTLQHILIDEFQDTSITQLTLLEALTMGWQPDDGKTLFIVGDGMQSCYGFRNANVGIFLDIRQHGLSNVAVKPLDLCVNFRSSDVIVDWVNHVFQSAFPQRDDIGQGAVSYSSSVAFHSNNRAASDVRCIGFEDQNDSHKEAQYIAEQILELQHTHINDSIAVLTRTKSHLQALIAVFKERGIAFEAVDFDPLISKPLIIDLVSLTKALHDPADQISWLSLLRTPWCGLNLNDISELVNTELLNETGNESEQKHGLSRRAIWFRVQQHHRISTLSDEGHRCLDRFRAPIELALGNSRRIPVAQWIESTWMALGGATSAFEKTDLIDVTSFFTLLGQYEQGGRIVDWQEFDLALAKLYATPRFSGSNAVTLLTMHKAKGLEFDTVFLPSLHRQRKTPDSTLLSWQQRLIETGPHHGESELIASPIQSVWQPAGDEQLSTFLRRQDAIKQQYEETRLLYVACTRARKRLYLSANIDIGEKGEMKPPQKSSLLARIWPQIEDSVKRGHDVSPSVDVTEQDPKLSNSILRLPFHWSAPSHTQRSDNTTNQGLDIFSEFDQSHRRQQHIGTLFHRILRQLTLQGLENWDAAKVQSSHPFWLHQLRQLGSDEEDKVLHSALDALGMAITRLRTNAEAAWVFNHHHRDSACEKEILTANGAIKIIDRTFIDDTTGKGPTRWIIDYKTTQPEPEQRMDDFITRQQKNYRQQMESYCLAMTPAEDNDVVETKTALYFPLIPLLAIY